MTRILACALVLSAPSVAFAQVCNKPKVLILLDISGSMLESNGGGTKYAAAKAGIDAALGNLQDRGKFGLMVFPSTPSLTTPSGYCWTSSELAVSYAENNRASIFAFLNDTANAPKSSYDTPLYQALANAAYLESELPDIVLVISDGKQDCPGGVNYGDYDYDADRSPNTRPGYGGFVAAEVEENRQDVGDVTLWLAQNNVKVYSIGFSTNADAATLNTIAVNGGTRRTPSCNASGTSTSDPNRCYYQANNTSELQTQLQTILYGSSNETCNNIDDDCDGWIDEDATGEVVLTTECANGCGFVSCVDGNFETCRQPEAENCNDFDDDCNGIVDDVPEIQCGGGSKKCVGGHWVAQDAEVCDGKDNDCDGQIDNGLTCPCSPGQQMDCGYAAVGACSPGKKTCQSNSQWGSCVGGQGPVDETCNGIDDDCDQVVDNLSGTCRDCRDLPGRLRCDAHGKPECLPVNPGPDKCNGVDDNCNGLIDEDGEKPVKDKCGEGNTTCKNGAPGPTNYTKVPDEVCNGNDDDCDGQIDEGCGCVNGTTAACEGACGAGVKKCNFGRWSECVGADNGQKEVCDGLDQNCNGMVDEEAICENASESCVCGHCVPPCNADGSCSNGGVCTNGMCEIGGCTLAPKPLETAAPAEETIKGRSTVRGGCGCHDTPATAVAPYVLLVLATAVLRRRRAS